MSRRARSVVLGAWLTLVWTALWGDARPPTMVAGAVVAALVIALSGPAPPAPEPLRVRPLAVLRLGGWFAVKLVEANLLVSREVVTPSNAIREAVVAVRLHTASEGLVTLVANMISLTPGTLVLEIEHTEPQPVLYVHVLHLKTVAAARADVHDLECRVMRAFGAADVLEAAERARVGAQEVAR